eukprot:766044-Hanusia_phi.AAC.2
MPVPASSSLLPAPQSWLYHKHCTHSYVHTLLEQLVVRRTCEPTASAPALVLSCLLPSLRIQRPVTGFCTFSLLSALSLPSSSTPSSAPRSASDTLPRAEDTSKDSKEARAAMHAHPATMKVMPSTLASNMRGHAARARTLLELAKAEAEPGEREGKKG